MKYASTVVVCCLYVVGKGSLVYKSKEVLIFDQNFCMQSLHHQGNFVKIRMLGVQDDVKHNL